jgi:hypothetical protein
MCCKLLFTNKNVCTKRRRIEAFQNKPLIYGNIQGLKKDNA